MSGAAANAAERWLVIRGITPAIWSCQLRPGRQTIGRSPDCDIVVTHRSVSRLHAEIQLHGTTLTIRDLRSLNGTFVNGQRVTESLQRVRDSVRLGRLMLDVLDQSEMIQCKSDNNLEGTDRDGDESDRERRIAEGLSDAQGRVLDRLQRGLSEKEAAQPLGVSPRTVHNQAQPIYRFFGVESRSELLALHISRRSVHKPRSEDGKP